MLSLDTVLLWEVSYFYLPFLLRNESPLSYETTSQSFFILGSSPILSKGFPCVRGFGRSPFLQLLVSRSYGVEGLRWNYWRVTFVESKASEVSPCFNGHLPGLKRSFCCLEEGLLASGALPVL